MVCLLGNYWNCLLGTQRLFIEVMEVLVVALNWTLDTVTILLFGRIIKLFEGHVDSSMC